MPAPKSIGFLHRLAVACGVTLVLWLAAASPTRADGVVHGFYFYSPDCPHCQAVADQVLPDLQARFGSRLELHKFDIRDSRNYQVLLNLEARYGVKEPGLPEAFVGPDALVGEEAMRSGLGAAIEKHLAAGGVDYPTQDEPVVVPSPAPASTPTGAPLLNVAYFYKQGCSACERTAYDLELMRSRYPSLRVAAFDIAARAPLAEALAERAGLPADRRLVTPAIFVGQDALVGTAVNAARLEAMLSRYVQAGAPAFWETLPTGGARESIVTRFRSFGLLTVVGAGLIDGLNPCAFATIVFFISYLAFLGRSRREMLLVGAAFTVGVFATYLLVGLGALHFVQALSGVRALGRVVYGAMAVLCLAFAGTSVHDAWQARHGHPEAMQLRLPRFLQQRVHKVIRENSSRATFVGVASLTGLVVSFLELACTGQVYLPTILFVLGVPQLRVHAVSYVVLYNLVFIAPLVVVFVVAAFGTSSARLANVVQKHTGTIKLLTAAVFAVLGVWLLTVVL